MIFLEIMGAPGAGKGTQAKRLSAERALTHVSTGDMFRENLRNQTELGRKANEYAKNGGLVPDDLVSDMVRERLKRDDCHKGCLLDGYPRTAAQVSDLDGILRLHGWERTAVLFLDVPEEEVVRRLAGRRVCSGCGHVARLETLSGGASCSDCGGTMIQRADDTEDVVRERLQVYRRETEPVLAIYRERGILRQVDGSGTEDQVFQRMLQSIEVKV
jgi:adenylate kinase